MNVLVACEESQAVCKAFRARGHRAFSCDLQECSGGHPEWHIQGDALQVINPCEKTISSPYYGTSFCTADGRYHGGPHIPDVWREVNKLSEEIKENRVSIADLKHVLATEYDIHV